MLVFLISICAICAVYLLLFKKENASRDTLVRYRCYKKDKIILKLNKRK